MHRQKVSRIDSALFYMHKMGKNASRLPIFSISVHLAQMQVKNTI